MHTRCIENKGESVGVIITNPCKTGKKNLELIKLTEGYSPPLTSGSLTLNIIYNVPYTATVPQI